MPLEILMPALSPTMTAGNLAKWVKKEGDNVEPGDVIAEIETDKATMEVESIDEGVIGKIVIKEGTQDVAVNACIALLLQEGESKDDLKNYKVKATAPAETAPEAASPEVNNVTPISAPPAAPAATPAPSFSAAPAVSSPITQQVVAVAESNERIKASPLAKKIAAQAGIDLQTVIGSGPRGRIVKEDVEQVIKTGGGQGVIRRNPQEVEAIANDQVRKVIAQRLLQSKQHVPHFYLTVECQLDNLLAVRQDINAESPVIDGKPAYKISVNDFVIKAVAAGLKKIPAANASWSDEAILRYNNVDVSVAVAFEGGLITPIIRNADQKSLLSISGEMKDLAARARNGKLAPEEFQGGGFSISNLGMYGIKQFQAIINPPQACILAIGAGEERVVAKNGKIETAQVMTVTLSSDHRVVDGAVGAEFLAAFKHYIEKPAALLI